MTAGMEIRDAFIVLGSEPIRMDVSESALLDSHIYALGNYVPRWARRRRLRRVRPIIRRFHAARDLWQWTARKPGAEYGLWYAFPSDKLAQTMSGTSEGDEMSDLTNDREEQIERARRALGPLPFAIYDEQDCRQWLARIVDALAPPVKAVPAAIGEARQSADVFAVCPHCRRRVDRLLVRTRRMGADGQTERKEPRDRP